MRKISFEVITDRRRFSDRRLCLFISAFLVVSLFAAAGCGERTESAGSFDGERAFKLLEKQCSFGPRYTGTPGHKAMIDFLRAELEGTADEVTTGKFTARADGKLRDFENVYAVFNPSASEFVLLCAHWDTRPKADEEVDDAKKSRPVMGANDGASGVAVLLELARNFKDNKPPVGVVMAFFDGEDYGPGPDSMFLGAKHFAADWKNAVKPGGREIKYRYGILLDMVGEKDLVIYREQHSVQRAPKVVDKVWSAAKSAGYGDVFRDEEKYAVMDDHWPLLAAGIECIDVIDFEYAHWHTVDDTPDKCSAKSLKTVGDVIGKVICSEGPAGK